MILSRPDTARARPSSLIKDNQVYESVFSEDFPISLYSHAAVLIRKVDVTLKSRSELTARDRTNLRFYVLLWLTCSLTNRKTPKPVDISKLDLKDVDDSEVEAAADEVWKIYTDLGATDQIAKGPELRKRTVEALTKQIPVVPPAPSTS